MPSLRFEERHAVHRGYLSFRPALDGDLTLLVFPRHCGSLEHSRNFVTRSLKGSNGIYLTVVLAYSRRDLRELIHGHDHLQEQVQHHHRDSRGHEYL